jgi:hypothetical protein
MVSPPPTPLTAAKRHQHNSSSSGHVSRTTSKTGVSPTHPPILAAALSTVCEDGLPQLFNCPQEAAAFWSQVRASHGISSPAASKKKAGLAKASRRKNRSLSVSSVSTVSGASNSYSSVPLSSSPPSSSCSSHSISGEKRKRQ